MPSLKDFGDVSTVTGSSPSPIRADRNHSCRTYEKHRNLTNEEIRERRGEMKRKWLKRRRTRPLPMIRYKKTDKEGMTSLVSEVGDIGMLRRKFMVKLKEPDAWKREYGLPHTREQVAIDLAVVEIGNRRSKKFGREASEE